ncbi:MAG TPA: hypothetical protein PLG47_03125 [Candidatus Dojkabacteria bacterium]|jgi:hypothetical protein|nr:hypothetical protein [Candidatus Dojkabacteria bacterium]
MEQELKNKSKFKLPKGPTIAGSVTIAFLSAAIIFGIIGFKFAEKYALPCPTQIQCVPCDVEKDDEPNDTCSTGNIVNDSIEITEQDVENPQ